MLPVFRYVGQSSCHHQEFFDKLLLGAHMGRETIPGRFRVWASEQGCASSAACMHAQGGYSAWANAGLPTKDSSEYAASPVAVISERLSGVSTAATGSL